MSGTSVEYSAAPVGQLRVTVDASHPPGGDPSERVRRPGCAVTREPGGPFRYPLRVRIVAGVTVGRKRKAEQVDRV